MGDEVGVLLEQQGLAIEELEQASAHAEEHRRTSHEELLGMMAALFLETSTDRKAHGECGGVSPQVQQGEMLYHHRRIVGGGGGRREVDPVPVRAVLGGKCHAYNIRAQNRAHRTRAAAAAALQQ